MLLDEMKANQPVFRIYPRTLITGVRLPFRIRVLMRLQFISDEFESQRDKVMTKNQMFFYVAIFHKVIPSKL
jgi:hypothetical protein